MDTLSATMVLVLIALLLVFVGYTYLALKNGYTLDALIDNIVGNLIGVLAAFLLFDILNNKLTQDAYARETSQQITKTLMGEPEILDSFSDEDKKTFLKSTITSMIKDEDAVDMLSTNMEKYFDRARGARIRKMFDYTINLEPNLTEEYVKAGFPGATDGKYYLIDEELKFSVKCLGGTDEIYTGDVINDLFMPILRIDNSGDNDDEAQFEVERKSNGFILKFKLDFDRNEASGEHLISIYFKMPRVWNSIFEVTLVDLPKERRDLPY